MPSRVILKINLGSGSAHESSYHCRVCDRSMNPVERMLGETCGSCTRRLHAKAVGHAREHGQMDICARCGAYRKHHASADHKFVLFPTDTYTIGKFSLQMRDAGEFSFGRSLKQATRIYRRHVRPGLRKLGKSARRTTKRAAYQAYKRL